MNSHQRSTFALLLMPVLASFAAGAQTGPVPNAQLAAKPLNARVDALLAQMTLEEKLGQLNELSGGFATGPGANNLRFDDLVAKGQVGSLANLSNAEATNHFQHIAMEKSRLHIPLLFGLDVIHGDHTVFPVPLAVAATWDPDAARMVAHTGAVEARADGVNWVFSPMVDIARDPRWGRIIESNGEDPYLGSVMARAWVRGYQQGDLTKPDSVATCVKHYAAYGAAIAGRDYNATDMSEITLRQVYLEPYRAAVEEGAASMMSSFNSINGVPASANPFILNEVLRKEWGFDGFVVSDWGAVAELMNHSIGDGPTVARKALEAGVDGDTEGNLYSTVIAPQVRSGKIAESVVDEAVRRILRVKFALGLFEHPYVVAGPAYDATPERRLLARKIADETLVLLKNDPVEGVGTLLPITARARKIALIGPMADNPRDQLGAWTYGDPKYAITLRKALAERLGDNLLYSPGCGLLTGEDEVTLGKVSFGGSVAAPASTPVLDDAKSIADATATAKQADVVILALGESANWMEGEAASRAYLGFTGEQEQLLEAVVATGKPVILVVMSGRPLEIKWAAQHVPAILEAWSPGVEGGHAIADVLFGDVNPSGKLPASLPRAVGQEPLYYAQLPTGRPANHIDLGRLPANSNEKFVSRYLDEDNSALFPFGWGLSYTSFSYSKPTISRGSVPLQEALSSAHAPIVKVAVEVRNTGSVAGTEIVQLYIRNTDASVEQPVRELKGFTRVQLAPGESKHVEFPLGFDELNFYNSEVKRTIEPSSYKIWIGGSSLATAETSLEIVE